MLKTFQHFQSALSLSGTQVDPYQVSHPMPQERIANLETLAKASPYFDTVDPPALQLRHDMMRAKIAAFTQGGQRPSRAVPQGSQEPRRRVWRRQLRLSARQSAHRIGQDRRADQGTAEKPLFLRIARRHPPERQQAEGGCRRPMPRPCSLDPAKSGTAAGLLWPGADGGRQPEVAREGGGRDSARGSAATRKTSAATATWPRPMASWARSPQAELATAEGYFYGGDYKDAKIFAMRAQQKMKRGAPGWVRAQDIINYRTPEEEMNLWAAGRRPTQRNGQDKRIDDHEQGNSVGCDRPRRGIGMLAIGYAGRTAAKPPAPSDDPQAISVASADGAVDRQEVEDHHPRILWQRTPKLLLEVQQALEAKQKEEQRVANLGVIKNAKDKIFNAAYDGVVGNPNGKATIVEFYDYNCGFCKRAIEDMQALTAADPDLRFVLKEFPILGPDSQKAHVVSMAFRKLMPEKYGEFHNQLLGGQGRAGEAAPSRSPCRSAPTRRSCART